MTVETSSGTVLLHLFINGGESTAQGWVFSILGTGLHDHLFTIVNNELRAGDDYISPGDKLVNISAVHPTYGTHNSTIIVPVDDKGFPIDFNFPLFTEGHAIPALGDEYEFVISYRYDRELQYPEPLVGGPYVQTDLEVLSIDGTPHITHYHDGSVKLVPLNVSLSEMTTAPGLIQGEDWFTLRIVREDRGSGPKTYYTINDTPIVEYTLDPIENITLIEICKAIAGDDPLTVSNVRLSAGIDVYVVEELKEGLGVFEFNWDINNLTTSAKYDGSDLATIVEGGSDPTTNLVQQWLDLSGNSKTLEAVSDIGRMSYNLESINGLNVISITEIDDHLLNASIPIDQNTCFFIVARSDFGGAILSDEHKYFIGTDGSNNFATYFGDGSAWNEIGTNTPNQSISTLSLMELINDNGVATPYVNGVAQDVKDGLMMNSTELNLAVSGFRGIVAEIIIVPRVPSFVIREYIEGHLAWKWGIQAQLPVGHRFELAAP